MTSRFPAAAVAVIACLLVPGARPVVGVERASGNAPAVLHPASSASAALNAAAERAGLRPAVLDLAVQAHRRVAVHGRTSSPLLTVIDYTMPSREKRLWVLDLDRDSVLVRELVAHGRNSGGDLATRFSNDPGSNQSSLGTFVTGMTYVGAHGLSLRLVGLDPGVNDNALERAIVMHGADYVNADIVRSLGRLGRSLGCPALATDVAPRVIDLIKDGTVMFVFGGRAEEKAG